jgi:hypothetical protein
LDQRILVWVVVNGAGNLAQSIAALHLVGFYLARRAAFSVVGHQFSGYLLNSFAFALGAPQCGLISIVIQVKG